MDREVWSSFTYDPRERSFQSLRASDQDRSLVQQVLSDAYADGRLDREEFDERSEAARTVRTLGDIDPLLSDLVAARPVTRSELVHASPADLQRLAQRRWEARRREAVFGFLGVSALTTAIWAAVAAPDLDPRTHFFWPIFVIVVGLIHLVRTLTSRREFVEGEVRRLERKRAKDLRRKSWGR